MGIARKVRRNAKELRYNKFRDEWTAERRRRSVLIAAYALNAEPREEDVPPPPLGPAPSRRQFEFALRRAQAAAAHESGLVTSDDDLPAAEEIPTLEWEEG